MELYAIELCSIGLKRIMNFSSCDDDDDDDIPDLTQKIVTSDQDVNGKHLTKENLKKVV